MKKLLFSFFFFGLLLAFTDATAQSSSNSMGSGSKDEYWGTSKTSKGVSADEVGERGSGLDKRFNDYEAKGARKSPFDKKRIKNSKKMKEIEKREKEMHKKHRRDKRMLARNRR